jgi:hypothetical protein
MSDETIDIKGLDKAELLHALYHGTRALGLGRLHDNSGLTVDDMRAVLAKDEGSAYQYDFDYFAGRPLKCNIGGDSFDPRLYDRDAGPGAAALAVAKLRAKAA